MQLNVEELGGLKRKISVEVPLKDVEATYDQVYSQIKGQISVKGFRPGKMPRQIVEKRFQDVMRQEATRSLLPKYFQQALEEMKARPATQPQFDNLEVEKSQPFKFEAEFEIIPSFELPEISGFTIKEKKVEAKPKDVKDRIDEMLGSRAELEDRDDAPAETGDVVTVDFEGKIKGEPFDGNSGMDQRIELGKEQFLKDFEEPLVGAVAGDRKNLDVTFPKDYAEKSLAGAKAQFDVHVKKVERKVPPELNEAFYSQFGQYESLEDFKAKISEQILQERERNVQQEYQQQISAQMKAKYSFDVPEKLVEQMLEEFEHQLGHEEPEVANDKKKLASRKKKESATIKDSLRLNYVIDEWGRQHSISVTKEEVQQRFFMQSYMMQQKPADLVNSPYRETMLFQIEQQILSAKVLEDVCKKVLGKDVEAGADAESGSAKSKKPADKSGREQSGKAAADVPSQDESTTGK